MVLRETAKPVPEELFSTPELASIVRDMKDALAPELEGVALAAPQISIPYRIFIVHMSRAFPTPDKDPQAEPIFDVYINPEIVKTSRRRANMEEGCLSVRGIYGTVKRVERMTIRARREDGSHFERGAGGLLAQIFEHEIDHLNGTLFTDKTERLIDIKPAHEHDAS